ncbi:hypothetical protein AB6T85_23600 [Erwinia sp. ACCC 02193]|uniref:DUF4325 domain-containing protein n=1 Tax=Erwinia aeris TaxID=3239803 RepID=A0ABV4EEM9_9GAMM
MMESKHGDGIKVPERKRDLIRVHSGTYSCTIYLDERPVNLSALIGLSNNGQFLDDFVPRLLDGEEFDVIGVSEALLQALRRAVAAEGEKLSARPPRDEYGNIGGSVMGMRRLALRRNIED